MAHQIIPYPQNILAEHKKYFELCLEWDYHEPVIITSQFPLVFKKGYCTSLFFQPISQLSPWPSIYDNFRKSFFAGKLVAALTKLNVSTILSGDYYYCLNEFSNNYYHWFSEALPKMLFVKECLDPNATFYIPFSISEYQQESLGMCHIRYFVKLADVAFLKQLKIVGGFTGSTGYFHPSFLKAIAKIVTGNFLTTNRPTRKIYVSRKGALRRRIINEDNVIAIMIKHGFEIFDFDSFGFREQVALLVNTSILVSSHGAALTNMIFMRTGATVLEFLPKNELTDKCYFIMAGALDLKYRYLFCETDGDNYIHANFVVDTKALDTLLLETLVQSHISGID